MIPRRLLLGMAAVYGLVVVGIVLAISPYFSAGWDPQIFAGAGRSLFDNAIPFDLYQASRQAWGDWGYPYPPLYAQLLGPALALSDLVTLIPDWVAVRMLPALCDVVLAVLLYLVVLERSDNRGLARAAAALWLFNPVTLYQTAVQAHQESSWLVCVVAAYALCGGAQRPTRHGRDSWLFLPSLLMACAVALKQSAVLFYIPYAVALLLRGRSGYRPLALAVVLFAVVFGGLSLPYYLHSPDYHYLVFVDVSNMPVQTQSAVVWLLGLKEYLIEQTRSSFVLLRFQPAITIALCFLLSVLYVRRDRDLFRLGLLVALLFFLTSKKVMGYHYPVLLPFLLVYALPRRRFDLVGIGILAASWIMVSPYYAPWASPDHFALYATIATPNTLLWLWLFVHVWRQQRSVRLGSLDVTRRLADGGAIAVGVLILATGMLLSSLAQPFASGSAGVKAGAFVLVIGFSLILAVPAARQLTGVASPLGPGHVALAVLLLPVYVAAFALTAESTRVIESLL